MCRKRTVIRPKPRSEDEAAAHLGRTGVIVQLIQGCPMMHGTLAIATNVLHRLALGALR